MANDAESENKQRLYYSTVPRRLVIDSAHYGLDNGDGGNTNGHNVVHQDVECYHEPDQPLDLSQMSPKSPITVNNTSPRIRVDSYNSDESNCNGCRQASVSPNALPQNFKFESTPANIRVDEQRHFPPRNSSPILVRQTISPVTQKRNSSPGVTQQNVMSTMPVQTVSPGLVQEQDRTANRNTRPFRAYNRDQIALQLGYYTLPVQNNIATTPLLAPAVIPGLNNEEGFAQFRNQMLEQSYTTGRRINSLLNSRQTNPRSTSTSERDVIKRPNSSPSQSTDSESPKDNGHDDQRSDGNTPESNMNTATPQSQSQRSSGSSNRKRGRTNDEVKDDGYWERRRKNNEAAKRSRDARRAKEDEIAIRAAYLEQENLKLKIQLATINRGQIYKEGGGEVTMESYPY